MKAKQSQWRKGRAGMLVGAAVALMGAGMVLLGPVRQEQWQSGADAALRRPTGQPQLVSIQPLPEREGEMCEWLPASAHTTLLAMALQGSPAAGEKELTAAQLADMSRRKHIRMIKDNYPSYSGIAVDEKNNEVVMTDESLFQVLVYDRMENTPPTATMSEPKRILGGLETFIEYQCAVYIDQNTGDIYAVNNDTVDKLVIFSRDKKGNAPPSRIINTPHTTYGVAVDEPHQELFLAVQEAGAVSVYKKTAKEDDPPIRLLQGDKTLLADPHGMAVDSKRNLLFVANFGNIASKDPSQAPRGSGGDGGYSSLSRKPNWPLARESAIPGSGRFVDASITIYPRDASGNTAPLRVIQGPKTQLSWPTALAVDSNRGDLFVANDTGDSILIFDVNAGGDVAPKRVIQGPKSLVKSPTGVYFDAKNDELWVSNYGNHSATVYKAGASGDVPPLRVIRSAPLDMPTPNIGNAHAPVYDSKRDQILVPN